MTQALIHPVMLRWARERLEWPAEYVAKKLPVKPEKFAMWELGKAHPTFRQAQMLARTLRIPFGYLFLSEPPDETPAIADLRTIRDEGYLQLSVDFLDTLNDALRKQDWYREYLQQEGAEPLAFIARYSVDDAVVRVARDIRSTLEIGHTLRRDARNWQDFLSLFTEKAESVGILVMRNSVVKNNNHRPLSVKEFRGFALSDKLAPVVFINSRDAKAAQIFTLAHELVHLWIGKSAISNPNLAYSPTEDEYQVERFCNQVAAEVLAPRADFLQRWNSQNSLEENIDEITRYYKVSSVVVLRRALELGRINRGSFLKQYKRELEKQRPVKESSGGDPYATYWTRNSRRLTQTVISVAFEGRLLFRDAASLLGVKVKTLDGLRERMEGR
jgi:Zn-dependent peptidase ImmA (M78 family)/DNA-binding XRE family transcriptional regulator